MEEMACPGVISGGPMRARHNSGRKSSAAEKRAARSPRESSRGKKRFTANRTRKLPRGRRKAQAGRSSAKSSQRRGELTGQARDSKWKYDGANRWRRSRLAFSPLGDSTAPLVFRARLLADKLNACRSVRFPPVPGLFPNALNCSKRRMPPWKCQKSGLLPGKLVTQKREQSEA